VKIIELQYFYNKREQKQEAQSITLWLRPVRQEYENINIKKSISRLAYLSLVNIMLEAYPNLQIKRKIDASIKTCKRS